MPYLTRSDKDALETGLIQPSTAGHLNYAMTTMFLDYIELKGLSYQTINDIMGAAESAKAEFYRRVAVPYENQKIKANGDVYTEDFDQEGC